MIVTSLNNFEDMCSGCFACYNVCPKKAINMRLNIIKEVVLQLSEC